MNDKGKDVNSDWLADQWDERSVLGHARVNKGGMKGDDPRVGCSLLVDGWLLAARCSLLFFSRKFASVSNCWISLQIQHGFIGGHH